MATQICHKCKIEKPYTNEFFHYRKKPITLKKICKECCSKNNKEYNLNHKKEVRKIKKQYYQNNKEEIIRKSKTYQENNIERYNSYQKQYRQDHSEESKEYNKKYQMDHKEEIYNNFLRWKENNKEKTKEYMNKYVKNRYEMEIQFKITNVLRSRIRMAIKNNAKSSNTINLLGCSIEELKLHIEKQFQPRMSWGNYGRNGWHIDHILPYDSFDLKNSEEQEICFHHTNLQPLWSKENRSKWNKIL